MDGHDVLGLDDVVAVDEFSGARMARHMHLRVLLRHDARAQAGQVVDNAVHGVLIARDQRGRQHDHVTRLNRHRTVRPYRHARQGGHRLALGAGRHVDALGGRQFTDTLEVHDDALGDRQVSFLLGDAHIALHGAAHERDATPVVSSGINNLLDAVHVRGEGGDDDLAGCLAENLVEDRANLAFGRDKARDQGIRGVHHEQVDAFLTHAGEGAQVGQAPVQRQLIHLEVTRNQDVARTRAHEDRERVGNRVGDGDEFEVEGADAEAVALGDDGEARVGQAVFAQLGGNEGQGQVGAVDRDIVAQFKQIGHGTDVVLVAVGEDHAHDVVHAVLDPGEIGEDEVDAGLAFLGEEDAAVHDQELAPVLEDVHVTADLAKTSQRDHSQCALFQGRGFAEILVQRLHGASLPRQRAFPRIGRSLRRVGPLTLGRGGDRVPSHRRGRDWTPPHGCRISRRFTVGRQRTGRGAGPRPRRR